MRRYIRFLKRVMSEPSFDLRTYLLNKMNHHLEEAQRKDLMNRFKSCGKDVSLQMPVWIRGVEEVAIGDEVSIAAYVHIWGTGGVEIGNRVMIASHTAITSLSHDYTKEEMQKTLISAKVTISDNVWIGTHSVIMPGVVIGKGAVVGAGSVVTRDVAPYSIVFGNPAKHFKFREIEEAN